MLISFSGIDGCGKTTQIENLRRVISGLGLSDQLLTFWDNVVVLSRYREEFVHTVYGSERGVGSPEKPVKRRDKNVRAWYLMLERHLLYLIDAIHLNIVVARAMRSGCDVIIFDRYIYDEMANLPLTNPLTRLWVQIIRLTVPQPDLALLLDADPEEARARKPEYPVDFMHKCRKSYFDLARSCATSPPYRRCRLPEAKREVELLFQEKIQGRRTSQSETAVPAA